MKIFKTFRDDLYGIYGVVQSAYGYKVFNILKTLETSHPSTIFCQANPFTSQPYKGLA